MSVSERCPPEYRGVRIREVSGKARCSEKTGVRIREVVGKERCPE